MDLISPSAIYRDAAGLTPSGADVVPEDTHCVMCAGSIAAGALAHKVTHKSFDDAFNNKLDLKAMTGTHICGDCDVLWTKDWMQRYSKSFACNEGVFSLAKNEDLCALVLNPPQPPFVAIFSTKQQQHMIWRTPVSYSRDYFFVRVDGDVVTIRRPLVLSALKAYHKAEEVMATVKPEGRATFLKPPAALFSRELASSKMGQLRADVEALLRQTGHEAIIEELHALGIGEWWALNALRFADLENPPDWRNAMQAASGEEG